MLNHSQKFQINLLGLWMTEASQSLKFILLLMIKVISRGSFSQVALGDMV